MFDPMTITLAAAFIAVMVIAAIAISGNNSVEPRTPHYEEYRREPVRRVLVPETKLAERTRRPEPVFKEVKTETGSEKSATQESQAQSATTTINKPDTVKQYRRPVIGVEPRKEKK